ncbi:ABC transporter permease [Microbacterium album]|uniref:Nitrate ABC transporter permease n=1 Tax=Microbacterium album TaxID=2053191 RepID=A0A917MMT0_9MICO|nr:ABC transporter permease [Microbacterium album]GGH49449.1 nitrate ABC transporter permease [Microbacterium album]
MTTTNVIVVARRRALFGPRFAPVGWGAAGIATLALALEVLPRLGFVNPTYFPPLHQMLGALGGLVQTQTFWAALGSTVLGWLLGLAIATVLGVALGIVVASIPIVDRMFSSTIEFLRPIPSVALVPLAAMLFGTTLQATLLLVVYASLWPILIQVVYGVRDVDRVGLDTARTYRLGLARTVRSVVTPSMLPYLVVGLRLSASIALILEVTGELVIGSPGLGRLIVNASASAATPMMYALVLVTALLGVAINVGTRAAERRVLFWHASVRSEGV